MKLKDFDYTLPANLIANAPKTPRDHSRLLILERDNGSIEHKKFFNISTYLKAGDVLVLNNNKVFPARLFGKKETGGKVEILLIRPIGAKIWESLVGSKRVRIGTTILFGKNLIGTVQDKNGSVYTIKFNVSKNKLLEIVNKIGVPPTPPYIKKYKGTRSALLKEYQTTYANDKKTGSVAAPTAGFHFTKPLLKKLGRMGVQIEYITLHVGYGTFQPVKSENIEEHKMHPEWIEINKKAAERINEAKKEHRRVIAVGTTSARALEATAKKSNSKSWPYRIKPRSGFINTYIYPGYKFKMIDGLITNFHLPRTSLLLLVAAFSSRSKIKKVYREAIKKKYRFYSFGDAMLIISKKEKLKLKRQ